MKLYNKILIISLVLLVIPAVLALFYFTDLAEETGEQLLKKRLLTQKKNLTLNLKTIKSDLFIQAVEQSDDLDKLKTEFDVVYSSSNFSQLDAETRRAIENKMPASDWAVINNQLALEMKLPIYEQWNDQVEKYLKVIEYIPQEKYLTSFDKQRKKFAIYWLEERKIINTNIYNSYGEEVVELPGFAAEIDQILTGEEHVFEQKVKLQGANYKFIFFPIQEKQQPLAGFALGVEREVAAGIIEVIKRGNWTVITVSLIVAAVSTLIISRMVVKPINKIKEFSQQVTEGEVNSKLDLARGDELGCLADSVNSMVKQLKEKMQGEKALREELAERNKQLNDAFVHTTNALARAAEAHDDDTGYHIKRVNEYSKLIAKTLGMGSDFINKIYYSAQMHDVGKIYIPSRILNKSGNLTEEEFETIKKHTIYGAEIIGDSQYLEMAAKIALNHHECYDGSGYPNQKQGKEIPLAARIVKLTDTYDALRTARPYKPGFSHKKTYDIIANGDERVKPEHFDPQVHDAFLEVHQQFNQIHQEWN